MKKAGNKNIKIIAATSMAIFTLLTTFSATFAWFTALRKTNDSADDFAIETASGALESISFHRLIENGKTMVTEGGISRPSKYEFEKTPVGTITYDWHADTQTISYTSVGDTSLDLETYTPLDQEHPLLLMINYREEYLASGNDRTITARSMVSHYLGERSGGNPVCDLDGSVYSSGQADANEMILKQEAVIDENTHVQAVNSLGNPIYKNWFPLSSAVKFQYSELAETGKSYDGQLSIDDVTTANTYEFNLTASEETTELKTGTNFVTIDDETEETPFNRNVDIYSANAGKHIKHIALVIDYNPDSIEYIYSTYLGNRVLEEDLDGFLYFTCDWTMVI